jgi:hypothetical protein
MTLTLEMIAICFFLLSLGLLYNSNGKDTFKNSNTLRRDKMKTILTALELSKQIKKA